MKASFFQSGRSKIEIAICSSLAMTVFQACHDFAANIYSAGGCVPSSLASLAQCRIVESRSESDARNFCRCTCALGP